MLLASAGIDQINGDGSANANANVHGNDWVAGKRHAENEDDASISWRKRKKHFFILSNSGKPIYSRYGDKHKLAGFSATLQAIISFVENDYSLDPLSFLALPCQPSFLSYSYNTILFRGDRVNLVCAGKHQESRTMKN